MSAVDNILTLLDKWPLWRRITEAPDQIEELRQRVSELEAKLGDSWPPDVCKFCGKRALRLYRTTDMGKGKVRQMWRCGECERTETKMV